VDEATYKNSEHTLFYMDLDRFKNVNDTGTHAAGDELLRQVSTLVGKGIRHNDTAARLGGDEFGFLLENCPLEDAVPIAETLCQSIKSLHFHWGKHLFTIGASIGVVAIDRDHADINKILNMADIACATAKNSGRNQVHVYQDSDKQIPQATEWLSLLNNSLENNLFCLYRQNIIDIDNQYSKHGEFYEILVRMRDDSGQLILPGAFFSAAERYDLLLNLDHWIIKHVCEWLSQDQQRLQNLHLISLNLSSSALGSTQLADFIIQQLTAWNLPANKFCFEFTEQSAITHLQTLPTLLNKLKAHGCVLALDNFGMGLSSFMALKDLPIDYLKIQGTFIQGILENPVDHEIVKAINNISHAMGIKTIAECVEEKDSMMPILKNLGMDYAQGYALAEPQPL
jgi:diguanylate cyclase (GGDEF)-like protein